MKYPKKTIEQYQKLDLMTANKEAILLMMYSGAIRFLKKALHAMKNNNIQEKGENIIKAQNIILELRATLNFSIGGDIATNLDSLYAYMVQQLITGNLENSQSKIEEVLGLVVNLNEAWEKAIQSLQASKMNKPKEDI